MSNIVRLLAVLGRINPAVWDAIIPHGPVGPAARVALNPQPLPPKEIRITAPAGVLTNLDAFQKAQAAVLNQAGCPGCHSGLRLIWQEFSEYEIDVEGRVSPVRGVAGPAAGMG